MKKKILVCLPSIANEDGIARVIMSYYEKQLLDKYEIDFLCVFNKKSLKYESLIKENNGNVFYIPKSNILTRFYNTLKTIIKLKNKYDIVHINLINIYALACVCGAKIKKSKIILHSHNPKIIGRPYMKIINDFAHYLCVKNSNYFLACSSSAGDSCFKENYTVLCNKVDVDRFMYDLSKRKKIRSKYNIVDNDIVIGVVARVTEQKNPFLIIRIFNEILKKCKNVKLLWIGDGNLKASILKLCNKLQLSDKVIFINESSCVDEFYCAMDRFLLPSKYEGLGIVFVEAQASGLLTYASSNVPRDVDVSDLIKFIDSADPELWTKKIVNDLNYKYDRKEYNAIIKESAFYKKIGKNELLEYYDFVIGCD